MITGQTVAVDGGALLLWGATQVMPTLKNTRSVGLEVLKGVTTRSPCILNRREAAAICYCY